MSLIVGLDISTTTIGIALLDLTGEIVKLEYLDLTPFDNLFKKAEVFREKAIELVKRYDIDRFCIEQYLLGFSHGASSVQVRTMLCQFNILCQYVLHQQFDDRIPIQLFSVVSGRSKVCKRMGWSIKGKGQKEKLFEHFMNAKLYTFDLKPKAKTPINQARDMVDAWLIAHSSRS